jgi:two-component system, NarL family, response regulator
MSGEGETPAARSPIRVMLCEDHVIVREGLVSLLEAHEDFRVIGQAGDGEAALALFRRDPPDVTLMDLRMPKLDGAEVIKVLRREYPGSRFLVLTTYDTEDDVTRALQAGASGYLLKGTNRATLRDAIRLVHAGRRFIPPEIADRVLPGAATEELTDREVEVLRRIAEGLSNREIGLQLGIGESTVKTHVNHLLGKLGVTDRTKALVLALKRGLVHID